MASAKKSSKTSRKAAEPVDLKAIETELNKDPEAQRAFVKNPGKFIEERGIKLRTADKAELKSLTAEMASGPRLPAGTEGSLSAGITIVIRRRF